MDGYTVDGISYQDVIPWIKKKHYAGRIPSILYAFGLFHERQLRGICTFGNIANYKEVQAWNPFRLLEFNRLVVDTLQKNAASFLIGNAIRKLPKPIVFISYADHRQGHIGYVYQATNWIYTGVGGAGQRIYILRDGTEKHQRHEKTLDMRRVERIEKTEGKARYYYFHGSKTDKKKMMNTLRFPVLPYPKGESKRYDASAKVVRYKLLF